MRHPETLLAWVLRGAAVLLILALVGVCLPFAWMSAIHECLGLGPLPDAPVVHYLARSLSLVYGLTGVLCYYVALDVHRHLGLLRLAGWLAVVLAAGLLGIDLVAGLPLLWTAIEVVTVLGFGLSILGLVKACAGRAR